jgi:hypothetical protein
MIESGAYHGHTFYGHWFQGADPAVQDFEYRGTEIINGPNIAATGPAEEFNADNKGLGFDESKPAGRFQKADLVARLQPHFLVIDGQAPGPDLTISKPFDIRSQRPPDASLAEIRGRQIVHKNPPEG